MFPHARLDPPVYFKKNAIMYKLFFLATAAYIASIYNFQINDVDNIAINLSDFQGKKILFVNIATGSTNAGQLGELQELQQKYSDSLVIIGFPSNSFGHEPKTNSEIKQFCQVQYLTSFRLAAKGSVRGTDIQPIYNWLTHQSENGVLNNDVVADFQKFLVDRNGLLIGVFGPGVSPMDSTIQNAITNN
jgi:glutathione peroxidase